MDLLKLVIVDDEPILLKGLVDTLSWNFIALAMSSVADGRGCCYRGACRQNLSYDSCLRENRLNCVRDVAHRQLRIKLPKFKS